MDNGRLDPGTHAKILQLLLESAPRINLPGLGLNASKRKLETKCDSKGRSLYDEADHMACAH